MRNNFRILVVNFLDIDDTNLWYFYAKVYDFFGDIIVCIDRFERVGIFDRAGKKQIGNLDTTRDGGSDFGKYCLSVMFYRHVRNCYIVGPVCFECVIRIDPSFMCIPGADCFVGQYSPEGDRRIWSLRVG